MFDLRSIAILCFSALCVPAYAQDAAPTAASDATSEPVTVTSTEPPAVDAVADAVDEPSFSLGLKAGLYVPRIVNHLGVNATLTLEAAYLLPFMQRMLAVQLEASYAPPGVSGSQSDPRIGSSGGTVTWDQRTHEVSFAVGPTIRFLSPSTHRFVPYASVLARLYLLRTHVDGTAGGQAIGTSDEVSTRVGVTGALGAELELGPGRLLAEVGLGWSQLPHAITGSTATTALAVQLGYRLML